MKKHLVGMLLVVAALLLVLAQVAVAQDMCVGDFDYDSDCDGTDAAVFKADFGRGGYNNPCPLDGPAPVPKTGQTTQYAVGDDGDVGMGVASPNPRFTDNGDGTATDNLTGLIWMIDAQCFGTRTWNNALYDCNNLAHGSCGLTDGSAPGYWRLPNMRQLLSLVDYSNDSPALPTGNPWDVPLNTSSLYWTSTTQSYDSNNAWGIYLSSGRPLFVAKTDSQRNLCVRVAEPSEGCSILEDCNSGECCCTDGNMRVCTFGPDCTNQEGWWCDDCRTGIHCPPDGSCCCNVDQFNFCMQGDLCNIIPGTCLP